MQPWFCGLVLIGYNSENVDIIGYNSEDVDITLDYFLYHC